MSEEREEDVDAESVPEEELEEQEGESLPDREVMTILPIDPANPTNLPPVE